MCSIESLTADIWLSNADKHMKLIESSLNEIPEIGITPPHCIRDGQLVRFRGMIQDMADPVLYLNRYEVVNSKTGSKVVRCGKYKDMLCIEEDEVVDEDSPNLEHCERRSIYCVSVPGLNSWAKPLTPSDRGTTSRNINMETSCSSLTQTKRNAEVMEHDGEDKSTSSETTKRKQTDAETCKEEVNLLLNHPIEDISNYSCLINVYEEIDETIVRINSVVDVIGFVSFTSKCDDFNHLPATLVPRLHAVTFKRISHSNPFQSSPTLDENAVLLKAQKIRSEIMCALTQLFLGDSLTAEYVLCNLISRIYHRSEVLSLGNFSVNITRIPVNSYSGEIYNILKSVLPKSHYMPMTLEKMNSSKFLPEKDYECNCLKSGVLQLSDHTHLFLDETKMEAGQLNSIGVQNVKALNELVTDQKLDYDFKYFKVEIPVDVPIIVLSEGKSLLSTNVQMILSPEAGHGDIESYLTIVKDLLKEPVLADIRKYLTVISHLEFNLAEDLIETIQQDYVKLRQEETRANESDLHLLLILARLVSLSFGQTTLTKEMWDKAFEMELSRKERLNNREP